MAEIGHNQPPEMAALAGEAAKGLSDWMAENPVIQTEDQARKAKLFIDRSSLFLKDMEDERKSKTAPLNEQIIVINNQYRGPRELLKGVLDELKRRFDSFLLFEEAKRIAAAQEAARVAAEAEQKARAAEDKEREAFAEADAGIVGLDIASLTAEADQTFAAAQKEIRTAIRAERDAHVRIGGGFRRAASLHTHESLIVEDAVAAIQEMGASQQILDAITSAARAYKKLHGRYPKGIKVVYERKS